MQIHEARRILRRIVASVAGLQIAHDASSTAPVVTVSIGAAFYDGRESMEGLYRRADAELYRCKLAGRNRAGIVGPSPVMTPDDESAGLVRQA